MKWYPLRAKDVVALLGVFVILVTAGCSALPSLHEPAQATATVQPAGDTITRENALPGTTDWQIPIGKNATTQIQAYAGATSVLPGQTLNFYVSTQKEGMQYTVNIYRLGWYGGKGGSLKTTISNQSGFSQGYYDQVHHHLIGCVSCHLEKSTGLVEANWLPTTTLTIPAQWVTGIYLAKFIDANDKQTFVPFVVRSTKPSTYLAVSSTTTYQAYNDWGGYSLYRAYDSDDEDPNPEAAQQSKGVKVSFNRPYTRGFGSGDLLLFEINAIRWFERQGYDLSYISSVDVHENPDQILQHQVYLSLGHDEYWSKEMRDGVEHARDRGVSLAFLGADAAYWQIRFEPGNTGSTDRTIVCYKVDTHEKNLSEDPLFGRDNTKVTSQWRDPVVNRPENALIGIMYSSLVQQQRGFAWRVADSAHSPLLEGTSLQPGQDYGCGLVGYEWDRIFNNGSTPAGLQVIGLTPTVDTKGKPDKSHTTYYMATSGAMVFATGSIYWMSALDSYRFRTDQNDACDKQTAIVPGMNTFMLHVMEALRTHHV